jgi:hypothetical protein
MSGDWLIAKHDDFERVVVGDLRPDEPLFTDMEARFLIASDVERSTLAPLTSASASDHGAFAHWQLRLPRPTGHIND